VALLQPRDKRFSYVFAYDLTLIEHILSTPTSPIKTMTKKETLFSVVSLEFLREE